MKKYPLRVMIVDDNKEICVMLSHLVKGEGLLPLVAYDGHVALEMIRSEGPDVLFVDVKMPGLDGIEVMRRVKKLDEDLPVVLITAYAGIHGAVEAIKEGAYDYLAKPFDNQEVIRIMHQALAERRLKLKLREPSIQVQEKNILREMMGPSDAIARLISDVNCVAKSDFSVIILGETGSGKDLVSQVIHQTSLRSEGPFVPIDCGAIPETLLENELFGHERGAFTGAEYKKPGKIEMAHGGTLFMDEISNLPLGSQAKLLRVIQEKKVYHLGSTQPVNIDVRFLAASNGDLHALIGTGSFRLDLFYRLNDFSISIPPLRGRKEDILYLAKWFLDTTNKELNKSVKGFSESAIEALLGYNWPGNVRQLKSVIRRAVLIADEKITEKHLDIKREPMPGLVFTPKVQGEAWKGLSLKEIKYQSNIAIEREILTQVLIYTGGNKSKAARILKVDYKTVWSKVKRLGISLE